MANGAKRILVVEDEKPMARAISAKLERSGFEVTMAGNGVEALEALGKGTYDLILLDLVMPGMDGWEVLKKMHDEGDKVPVVVATNLSQKEDEKRAKELGAKDFFVKSNIPINEVVERLKKILS